MAVYESSKTPLMTSCRAGEYNVEYDVELIVRQARPEEDGLENS